MWGDYGRCKDREASLLIHCCLLCKQFIFHPIQRFTLATFNWKIKSATQKGLKCCWLYHYFREENAAAYLRIAVKTPLKIFRQCNEIPSCETANMTGLNHSKWRPSVRILVVRWTRGLKTNWPSTRHWTTMWHWGSGALSLCSWAPGNHRSGFHDFQLPGYVLCHNLQEEEEKEKESEVKEEKVKGEEVK